MSDQLVVTTSYGKLRSGTAMSRRGRKFKYFAGIPYAEPPVGPLRFQPPIPHEGWEGIRDASKEGKAAVQVDTFTKKIWGDEDCLFANIYTPQCDGPLKPVLVMIHGGAFGIGSGGATLYGGHFLMDHDIVLVTFNYRLGALGFLNLDLEGASGNMGMKDQVLLLTWIQNEITHFGGDPNNVTISGCSAGAASVHYHMVSPLSKGLFHKAIAESGTIPCEWAFMKRHYEKSFELGEHLGYNATSEEDLLEYLKTVPAERFVEVQNLVVSTEKHVRGNNWGFVPSVETVGKDMFLATDPHELIVGDNTADVPFLTGVNIHEGFLITSDITSQPFLLEKLNTDFKVLFEDLEFPPSLTAEEVTTLANRIKIKYFKGETIEYPKHFEELVDLYGALLIKIPAVLTLHHLKNKPRKNPIFFYTFSVDTPLGWFKQDLIRRKALQRGQKGVSHCDELGYLYSCAMNTGKIIESGSLADKTITRMTKMWANFIRTGDPSADVEWKPVSSSEYDHPMGLNIGEELVFEPAKEFDLLSNFKELIKP